MIETSFTVVPGKEARVLSMVTAPEQQLRNDLLKVIRGTLVPRFHFQPIADLRLGAVAGYEALVRLPLRTSLPPDQCIRAASRFGLQMELESVLVRQALMAQPALPANTFLSINASPAFLCSSHWDRMRFEYQDLAGIVLEITESECIDDYESMRRCIDDILTRGGLVAIDDAGAGYASLQHILQLKPSFIKLDRALIQNCDRDRAKATLIQVLGDAANRMDAWIITEGVETAQELAELIRLRVPLAQGYYLGYPQPEMQPLTQPSQQLIHLLAPHRAGPEGLLLYVDSCPSTASRAEAGSKLKQGGDLVAVVDPWGRPMELLERHITDGVRLLSGPMRCNLACDLRDALQRALTRGPACRFDPILVTDQEGRLQGVVRVDRLMLAVLEKGVDRSA